MQKILDVSYDNGSPKEMSVLYGLADHTTKDPNLPGGLIKSLIKPICFNIIVSDANVAITIPTPPEPEINNIVSRDGFNLVSRDGFSITTRS